jgi:outer membrane lipoprotein SlyB
MNTNPTSPAVRRQHPLLIIAALAVILFCAVGTAAIMGWLPNSKGSSRDQLSDADRAALAAGLQQPGQPAYAVQPAPAPAPVTTPGMPVQSLAAAPSAAGAQVQYEPPASQGSTSYGSSGSQGSTAYGGEGTAAYAPVPAPAPATVDAPVQKTRVAELETEAGSGSRWCASCGNVEAVRTITTRARGTGVGAAGGAILGGLLGNQVGGGHGRQLATVAGAVGGAVMGNQVEGNMKATHSYEIRVRLDDGTLRTFHQHSAPRWRNGDRVRVVKGALRAA